jgi:hypothetical protein
MSALPQAIVPNLQNQFRECIYSTSGPGFPSNSVSIVVYHLIQIIRYKFRSYDHLQEEIYTSENRVALDGNP